MSDKRTPNDIAKEFENTMAGFDANEANEFIEEVLDTVKEPIKKIPEPVFREIFLPFFTGERKADSANDAMAHWAGLVGSHMEPAEIVDVKGEVLFVVPPLMDSSQIKNTPSGKSFGSIMVDYVESAKLHPGLGKEVIVNDLSAKYDSTVKGSADGHGWDPILKYYGIAREEIAAKTAAVNGDDDLVFNDD